MVGIFKTEIPDIQYFWLLATIYLFKADNRGQVSCERLSGFRGEVLLTSSSPLFVSHSNKL